MDSLSLPQLKSYIKEKWQHAGFQKYFRNTGWLFLGRAMSMIISFLTTAIIARHLGPSNFGQLSYAVSFVAILSFVATLGIDGVLYRDLIRNPKDKAKILGSAFGIKLGAGIFTAILTFVLAILFSKDDVSRTLIFILSGTFIFNSLQIINYEFQARVESKYPSIISLVITLILNSLKILIIMNDKGVIYLSLVLLLESVLYATFYWFVYVKKLNGKILSWKFNTKIASTLLKDSWPLIFSSAFALILSRIDQVLIKGMLDSHSVGIYDSAVRIAEIWYFVPNILMVSLFPAIVNAKQTSETQYNSRLGRLALLLLVISTVVAIFTTIFASLIIKLIFGPTFLESTIILKIYVWSNIGTFLSILVGNYLITENFRKIILINSLISMISNVILNLIWIPKYGIVGSAYATLVSYLLGPLSLLLFKKTRLRIILISKDLGFNKLRIFKN